MSCITVESEHLLRLEAGNRHAHQAAGGRLFGADAGEWPAWWWDVVNILERQRILENNARIEAEQQ